MLAGEEDGPDRGIYSTSGTGLGAFFIMEDIQTLP